MCSLWQNQTGQQHDRWYRSTRKTMPNYHDQSNQMQFVMKTKLNNDTTDCTGAVYIKNDSKLSWPIKLGVNCDENQIGQLRY